MVLTPAVRAGYRIYRGTDRTPTWAYRAMRKLFGSDPNSFESVVSRARNEHPRLEGLDSSNGLAAGFVDEAVVRLRRDGLVMLPRRLAAAECNELETTARSSTCTLIGAAPGHPDRGKFGEDGVVATRHDLDEVDAAGCPAAQRLLADESLLAVAQEYLEASPVQDLVAMWWSSSTGEAGSASEAAQQFHFDLDRLAFLKLFVFLTDVDDQTGPHVFARGSHRALGQQFHQDRRYTDAEVTDVYAESLVRIGGPRGSAFLADTRGLHKGEPVLSGHRLVFQMEYASSLFGHPVRRLRLPSCTAELESIMRRYPSAYRRFEW